MTPQLPSARGPRSLVIGLLLLAVYLAYHTATSPWLDTTSAKRQARQPAGPVTVSDFTDLSRKWFPAPEDRWVASAGKKFRDGQRYLFFQQFQQSEGGPNYGGGDRVYAMTVEPVAVLWLQDGHEQPVTLTAKKAQLDRTEPLSLEKPEFGRIRRGFLSGAVTIRGPQGLLIEGTNFTVDEDSLKIFSSQAVEFAWDRHRGRAENGVEIQLLASAEGRDGLMSVSDVQSIRLNGRVRCELVADADKPREPTNTISINAARGFEFRVQERLATFFGFEDHRDRREDNQIVVRRPGPSGGHDQLICTQLTLQLRPRIRPPGTKPQHAGGMELQSIHAEGSRVWLSSVEHALKALQTSLRYTVDSRTIELTSPIANMTGGPGNVEIRQNGTRVLAPRIVVVLGDDNRIRTAECIGPGKITHPGKTDETAVEADWKGSCVVDQIPRRRVVIHGVARVAQPARKFAMTGDLIEMTLNDETGTERPGTAAADTTASHPTDLSFSQLRPDVLTARGNVTLAAPQLSGIARDQLTVNFRPAADPAGAAGDTEASGGIRQPETGPAAIGVVDESAFTHIEADTFQVSVLSSVAADGGTEPAQLSQMWISGRVEVEFTAVDPEKSFHARGNVLHADNGTTSGHDVSLFGNPATIVSATRVIEGQRIDLNDHRREASVRGSGRIRLVVERDLSGTALEKPAPLDIYWGDQMNFAGRTAKFVGNIRAVVSAETHDNQTQNVEVRCPAMNVVLADTATAPASGGDTLAGDAPLVRPVALVRRSTSQIEQIECESRVDIRMEQHADGVATERHVAMVSDLKVNLQTGEILAAGPGWIESTQPDQGNQLKLASAVTVQANRTARARENQFVFVRASFIGSVTGNFEQRVLRLHQHVAGVFGPVRRLGDQIEVNSVSPADLPDQTGIVRCELLTVHAIPGLTSGQQSFALIAETNADLESRQFKGSADRITYDHSKEQFVLKAENGGLATVFHHPENSLESHSFVGQSFKYYPRRDELQGDELVGVRTSR